MVRMGSPGKHFPRRDAIGLVGGLRYLSMALISVIVLSPASFQLGKGPAQRSRTHPSQGRGELSASTCSPCSRPRIQRVARVASRTLPEVVAVSRTLTRTADAVRSSGVSSSRPYRLVDSSTVVKVGDGLNQLAALFAEFTGASSGLLGDDDLEAAAALNPGTSVAVLVWENRWA